MLTFFVRVSSNRLLLEAQSCLQQQVQVLNEEKVTLQAEVEEQRQELQRKAGEAQEKKWARFVSRFALCAISMCINWTFLSRKLPQCRGWTWEEAVRGAVCQSQALPGQSVITTWAFLIYYVEICCGIKSSIKRIALHFARFIHCHNPDKHMRRNIHWNCQWLFFRK